jgi:chromosome segregation protein
MLLGSKWRDVSSVLLSKEKEVKDQELKVEEINSEKNTSDSEIIKLRAKQIELQTALDKVQQEFYSFGADISRTEQEISLKKDRVNEINDKISINQIQIDTRTKEIEKLTENKSSAQLEISSIENELKSLKENNDEPNKAEAEKIEGSWLLFITETKDILTNIFSSIGLIKSKLSNKESIEDDIQQIESLQSELKRLESEPTRLTKLTQDFLVNASEGAKQQRINLIEKTDKYAELQAKLASLVSEDSHINTKLQDLNNENINLEKESKELIEPINEIQQKLDNLLSNRLKVEESLLDSRKAIEDCNASIHRIEREKIEKEQAAITLRELLENLRLERQASKIEQNNIEKQVDELQGDLEKIKNDLQEDKSVESYSTDLENIELKISRLGAINLAAMEEYDQESKRKDLLDEQHNELMEALETLERAITKIDKETRTTFKDTFDKLNNSLSQSFPKLFGGGHAELVMLGDDLLTCGIGISARPPGKKNASVSQLSGGEKALTAIATVFAFFELNPAPFCLLDEVDAPLDDLNTMRFIDLVDEMSQRVQFVYITHNKISMEKSKHLMGVTMQEPGVSRMVAVDVDQAVEMAAS